MSFSQLVREAVDMTSSVKWPNFTINTTIKRYPRCEHLCPHCPRVAQRDCCRAKSDLRSESCSKPEAQSARDGRNRRTERKKGGREQELRNSQEKRP